MQNNKQGVKAFIPSTFLSLLVPPSHHPNKKIIKASRRQGVYTKKREGGDLPPLFTQLFPLRLRLGTIFSYNPGTISRILSP
jgi:hypothetical protein